MKLALAGDTMLGRNVAERLAEVSPSALFADGVVAAAREADLFILNLECAISDRGEPWPDPSRPFFFRAPPVAVDALRHLGVGCVTLANNHALDFGTVALLDTCRHLADAGIEWVGAGVDFDGCAPTRVEAVPLALDYCHTQLAHRDEAAWVTSRFRRACAGLGTGVEEHDEDGEEDAVLTPLEPEEEAEGDEAEATLDEILRQRFEGEEEYEEEEPECRAIAPSAEDVRPRMAEEFVCQSCFLVKHRIQLADPSRSLCRDCVNNAHT